MMWIVGQSPVEATLAVLGVVWLIWTLVLALVPSGSTRKRGHGGD